MRLKITPSNSLGNNNDALFFRSFAFVLLMALPSIFINATLPNPHQAPPPTEYQKLKARVAEDVYLKIAHAVKDTRKAPTFNFIFSQTDKPYYNAYFNPQNNTINFGEGIYDIAVQFGADSLNALAMVIGHELAHFYKDHGWGMSFGMANEETEIAQKIYDLELNSDVRARMEAEADYFGGLFGYMAGFNTLKVGGEFFDKLYSVVGIPDSTFGYPTRRDRVNICNNSRKMLTQLVPVFKAANVLTLTGEYEKAAMCYDHIISVFPSREIYNNAGVAYLHAAMATFQEEELKYLFPTGLDFETRMNNAGEKGGKVDMVVSPRRMEFLKKAKNEFEDAIRIDEAYGPAYVNLAIALSLMKDFEMAQALASKGAKLALADGNLLLEANAHIVKGICYAMVDKKSDAKKELQEAKKGNSLLAEANLEAVNNNTLAKLFKKKLEKEKAGATETIAEVGLEVMEILFEDRNKVVATIIARQNEDRPETIVVSVNEPELEAIMVATYGGYLGLDEQVQGMLVTKADYKGMSARGIHIGSSLKSLQEKYGEASNILGGVQANYHHYQKSNIIFTTNSNEIVTGWILFGRLQ